MMIIHFKIIISSLNYRLITFELAKIELKYLSVGYLWDHQNPD